MRKRLQGFRACTVRAKHGQHLAIQEAMALKPKSCRQTGVGRDRQGRMCPHQVDVPALVAVVGVPGPGGLHRSFEGRGEVHAVNGP